MKRMPYTTDKEDLVYEFTNGRTVHLHEMTDKEYHEMTRTMWKLLPDSCDLKTNLRRARRATLNAMRDLGVDTTTWDSINAFCRQPDVAGCDFYFISAEQHKTLQRKIRGMADRRRLAANKENKEKAKDLKD